MAMMGLNSCTEEQHFERAGWMFGLLHQIIKKSGDTCYQPPRWESEPTKEQLQSESDYLESTEEAEDECLRLMKQLVEFAFDNKWTICEKKNVSQNS